MIADIISAIANFFKLLRTPKEKRDDKIAEFRKAASERRDARRERRALRAAERMLQKAEAAKRRR